MQPPRIIQSLARAFEIVDCFTIPHQQLSAHEISEKLSIHVNTVRGLIATLVYFGYLRHHETSHTYSLGPAFREKSLLAAPAFSPEFLAAAQHFLHQMSDQFSLTARLHLVEDSRLIMVLSIDPSDQRYILQVRTSEKKVLHATASGKLILAALPERQREEYLSTMSQEAFTDHTITERKTLEKELQHIKERGYSRELEEIGVGISSLAVGLKKDNKLLYTISCTGTSRIIVEHEEEIVRRLKAFAQECELYTK